AGTPLVMDFGADAQAEGSWVRTDGGEKLGPVGVSIRCDREKGSCISATVNSHGTNFFAPDISIFPATFTKDAITYVDDFPTCVLYRTTIDLKQERATSSRILKPGAKADGECKAIREPVIRMELGTAPIDTKPLEDHFVPLLSLLLPVLAFVF
ncbi:MAG TPA: hypothetical protein VNI79_05460, partial [Sphingomicrobium sp.]|nr:hypothetical protein [Sphingomicrobium sp.]